MNFVDAVRQRHLVHWHDRGFIRTVEPYLFAQFPGARLVLVAFQIAGGPPSECQHSWKVIDLSDGLNIETSRTFTEKREIPAHLLGLAQLVYASAGSPSTPSSETSGLGWQRSRCSSANRLPIANEGLAPRVPFRKAAIVD